MPIFANDSQFEYGAPLIEGFDGHEGNTDMSGAISGCTYPTATNYNAEATQDDGSCTFDTTSGSSTAIVSGCMDSTATNYNEDATQDDGSCTYGATSGSSTSIISGCTDPTATNFNENATQDDGSCNYDKTTSGSGSGNGNECRGHMIDGTCFVPEDNGETFIDYEGFQGNNMVDNGVGNLVAPQQNLVDINLLLKSLLFACLFYILSHADVAKMLKGVIGKLSQEHQRLSMLVLFAVCYYVINMFI